MPHSSTATAAASRTALGAVADARAQFGAGLAALILALLARLLGRAAAAWDLSPHIYEEYEDEHGPDFVYVVPFVGRALHAICVEAGLVPGWVFAGRPRSGMRSTPNQAHTRTRPLTARAPPSSPVSRA
jgi:hypothetical protein